MFEKIYIGKQSASLERGKPHEEISKVVCLFEAADGTPQEVEAGDDTGGAIEVSLQGVTDSGYGRQIAQNILQSLEGHIYRPYRSRDTILDPAFELGDGVTFDGFYSVIGASLGICDALFSADLEAEDTSEADKEFIYQPSTQRAIERKIAQTRASLRVDVDQIEAMVESLDGSVSALSVSVGEISTEVRGKIDGQQAQTLIDQTLQDITLSVSGTDGSTTFTLKQGGATLDTTTFDLHVDAVNIEGTLTAESIRGSVFELLDDDDDTAASFYLTGATSIDDRKIVIESGAIELSTTGGDIFLSTHIGSLMQVAGLQIHSDAYLVSSVGDFVPQSDNGYNLGLSYLKWKQVWATTGTIQTSDRNKKKDISYDLSDMDAFFDALRPVSYKFIDGESGRTHYGLIAQDTEQALLGIGKTTQDFGGLCKDENKDGGVDYALRYDEFIGLCIDQIQKLKARVNALETAS